MRFSLGHYLGVSIQTEIIFMTLCGMLLTPFDESLTNLNSNLQIIWGTDFPAKYFTPFSAHVILSIVSGVVVIRSFTLHLYMAFYVVMLWPAIFGEKPSFLIPWLIIGGIKTLLMKILCLTTGIAICIISKNYNHIMVEFILSNVLTLSLSSYMWFTVMKYYKILKKPVTLEYQLVPQSDSKVLFEVAVRRHLMRSMASEENIRQRLLNYQPKEVNSSKTSAWSNSFQGTSSMNIDSIFDKKPGEATKTRSLDDYHKPTRLMCDSEVSEAVGSYDLIFKSNMTPAEKAKKVLHLTDSDIEKAKKKYSSTDTPIYWGENDYHQPDLCAQIASKVLPKAEKPKIVFATCSEVEIETIDFSNDFHDETSNEKIDEKNQIQMDEATEKKSFESISKDNPDFSSIDSHNGATNENECNRTVNEITIVESQTQVNHVIEQKSIPKDKPIDKDITDDKPTKISNEKKTFHSKLKNTYKFIPPECTNCGGVKSQTYINSNNLPQLITLSLKSKEPVLVDATCQVSNIRIKYLNPNCTSNNKADSKIPLNSKVQKKRFGKSNPVVSRPDMKTPAQNTSEEVVFLQKKHMVSVNYVKEQEKLLNDIESFNTNNLTIEQFNEDKSK